MRTSEQIKAEIEERFGFFPPFFSPAFEMPEVLENLWQQTLSAYVNNPIPALFKEKLFAYLSRYCSVPYCIVCHCCTLRPLGMAAEEVFNLLQNPPPIEETGLEESLRVIAAEKGPLAVWPPSNSTLENSLLSCFIFIFLNPYRARHCMEEMRRLLGPINYNHLMTFLSYVKTCHLWVESHPELSYEADKRIQENLGILLREEPRLAYFFANYTERIRQEQQRQEERLNAQINELKRTKEEIRLLHTITQAVIEAKDFNTALETALRMICETTGWVFGEVWIPSQDGSHLEYSPVWHGSIKGLEKFRKASEAFKFRLDEGLPGRVWASKKPEWRENTTVNHKFLRAEIAKEAGLKGGMAIRVLADDRVVAIMAFFVLQPRKEDERLIKLISTVAAQLGTIFQQKYAEELADRSQKNYEDLVSTIDGIVWEVDAQIFQFTFISKQAEQILGYPLEQWLNEPTFWKDHIHPDDREWAVQYCSNATAEKRSHEFEYRMLANDGRIVWLHDIVTVLVKDDKPVKLRGVMIDITERKKLEAQLRHAQKMEAIGELAGGIAHDFNNFLTAIIGFGELLHMKIAKDDPLRVNVEQILSSAEKATNLTQSILALGRKQAINLKPVNLNEIIKEVQKLLSRIIREDIKLNTVLTNKDLIVTADRTQIDQVLINLATNARDAMPKGGSLTIEAHHAKLDNEFIKTHGYGKPGTYALISVTDTGMGMDENTKEKIFEPFFTTKDVGKGTGLGLAIVYGIIKQHDGYINVYSEVGRGTTFKIYLPIVRARAEEAKVVEPAPPERGTETVLVAEDDENIRGLIKTVLEEYGYNVIEAVDGEKAIEKFMKNKDKIQLLILDVIMPRKNGKEVYNEVRKVSPDIKTLFMSGYSADIIKEKEILEEELNFIPKPISPVEFLRKIREVLEK